MSYSPKFRGEVSTAPTTEVRVGAVNNSGLTITKSTPVGIDASGELRVIDVSDETDAFSVIGVVSSNVLDGNIGQISSGGRLEDITTSATFGDTVYISKSGALSSVKPSIGVGSFVSGDFVISMGVVVKNDGNPTLKDLIVNVQIKGQL